MSTVRGKRGKIRQVFQTEVVLRRGYPCEPWLHWYGLAAPTLILSKAKFRAGDIVRVSVERISKGAKR